MAKPFYVNPRYQDNIEKPTDFIMVKVVLFEEYEHLLEVVEYLIPKDCWCDNELMIQCDECTLRNTITNICRKHHGK